MLKEVTTYLKPSSQCITQIKKEKKKKKETKNTLKVNNLLMLFEHTLFPLNIIFESLIHY